MTDGGVVYTNPRDPYDTIRIMPGDAKSFNPAQQQPYVIDQCGGEFLTVNGSRARGGDSADMHIPLQNYNFTKRGEVSLSQSMNSARWLEIVKKVFVRITDRDSQERAWFNRGPEVSSPTELICQLRSDFSFTATIQASWVELSDAQ